MSNNEEYRGADLRIIRKLDRIIELLEKIAHSGLGCDKS